MMEAGMSETVQFVWEHFGGNVAVILFLIWQSWKWSRRVAKYELAFEDIQQKLEDIAQANHEEHKEFRNDIKTLEIDMGKVKQKVGVE